MNKYTDAPPHQWPDQHIAQDQAARAGRVAVPVDELDVPGLHGQRLAAAAPAQHEVGADGGKQPGLPRPAKLQRILALRQRIQQVARQEHHAKQQHGFVHHAGESAQPIGSLVKEGVGRHGPAL
ncbi:hypothetical protein G6F24_016768 [Rhizopus arrhizus]|nr:hypothetical protein G6F24_016768 [Rhizopus arrhizus]